MTYITFRRRDSSISIPSLTTSTSTSSTKHQLATSATSRELYDRIVSKSLSPPTSSIPDTPTTDSWMPETPTYGYPSIRIQNPEYPFTHPAYYDQSNAYNIASDISNWPMYQPMQSNFGIANPAFQHSNAYGLHRGHKRQASDSTIASNGPDSPYPQTTSYPFIVNTDRSPTTTTYFGEDGAGTFAKPRSAGDYQSLPVGYMPSQLSHTPAAHSAMKDMAIDHHNSGEDVPDFASSRRSGSTHGRNTPSTPRTHNGEDMEDRAYKTSSNADFRAGPRVELHRTESAAYQDELYNPANFMPSVTQHAAPQQAFTQNNLLSPHRNLVNERIKIANSIRSQSPVVAGTQRDRSPFRRGSPLAPTDSYISPGPVLSTAEAVRRQQRDQASAQEFARHQPQLKREETKTISPKDAVLDYTENEQDSGMAMFNDTIPSGYQRHFGGTETYPNNFISGTNQAFGQFAPQSQAAAMSNFRAADGGSANNFNFVAPTNGQANPYANHSFRAANNAMGLTEHTPEFPAHLTSMESSISDNPPQSSQESNMISPIQRPVNTSANSGTYTCTLQGCAQRFESPMKLQKHKRDSHQPEPERQMSGSDSAHSAHSSESPTSLGSEMTSGALLARNSQAGPHKCARINPSTGKPCNTIFSRPYDLTRHEDTIHNRQKQKVRCQFCREEKTFSRNDALTRHMRVVHPEIDFQGKRGRRDY